MNKVVGDRIPATAVVVDLRGFTLELNRTGGEEAQRLRFCEMLSEMNAAVVEAARVAIPPSHRGALSRWVHVGSTGDGAIVVFLDPERHARSGLLAALLLEARLERACADYNRLATPPAPMAFGIGVESGAVRRVGAEGALSLTTVIGGCINAAARVQDLTKEIHRTRMLVCGGLVERLTRVLLHEDYSALMEASTVPAGSVDDATFFELERRMVALNRRLCLSFLHLHRLRGFPEPIPLFRVSRSSAVIGTARFDALVDGLVHGDESWHEEVRWHFSGSG